MKSKWLKHIFTLVTLLFCMSVFYVPALADEVDEETATPPDYEMQQSGTGEISAVPHDYDWEADELNLRSLLDSDALAELGQGAPQATVEPQVTQVDISEALGLQPFTPSGTGTVVDNATDGDGKEFFTITTDDGDIFYLIIDRQRNSDNVYFLNAVTINDLVALAEKNESEIPGVSGAAPPTGEAGVGGFEPDESPEPESVAESTSSNSAMYIIIGVVVAGVGGAAYYFKIVKGKKDAHDDDDDYDDDDEDEYGYDDGTEADSVESEDESDNEQLAL